MTLLYLLLGSYLLGNILTATIISNLFYKKEIHSEGSGNPGARNVGRVFGKKAFVATFFGDAIKGALAVLATKWLGFGMTIEILALIAVLLGHIYPVFFKFRGGQGISAFIGGLLAFNLPTFAVFVGIFLLLYAFIRSFTVAGLSAIVVVPVIVLSLSLGLQVFIATCFLSSLVLLAHKDDLKEKFMKERGGV
ncbi:glycerol-3-phosphate acyltransferase [Sporosarcina limicola]|uniref:Glycerol-3-phosphate acyltransferase n=1 Tax=Sporosarcina limicola TaxID=34101 RepID=A0A927RBC5_9BACL|nr:glycerol-3-phosphate acyltransferase [Sporosarcina limicola]MBE1553245.1 glycerol-3-phosphate acyltransferase PlsY [Sporosarcina limicola]